LRCPQEDGAFRLVATWATEYAWNSNAATIALTSPQTATPTFSPAAGTYTSAQSVTISDATSGSTIYYTTNGTTPTTSSTKYTGAISVGSTETIQAIAVASGHSQSAVGSAAYTINPTFAATATASPSSVAPNGSSTISFSVKGTGVAFSNANVEVQVFNSSGSAVGTQTYTAQNFTANGTNSYTYTWTPSSQSPAVTAAGNYTVMIGVFNSSWGADFYWNSSAATITLQ
jgi:Chitobiase/beta-hexosaminidase C-terminal domain